MHALWKAVPRLSNDTTKKAQSKKQINPRRQSRCATLLDHNLLHLGETLHCMVWNTLPKHEQAEAPLQVIVSELLALLCLHFKVTNRNRLHASSLLGFCCLFPRLLPISCDSKISSDRHLQAAAISSPNGGSSKHTSGTHKIAAASAEEDEKTSCQPDGDFIDERCCFARQ